MLTMIFVFRKMCFYEECVCRKVTQVYFIYFLHCMINNNMKICKHQNILDDIFYRDKIENTFKIKPYD